MADEPRRSGRPTKGVHTKIDSDEMPEPKKKGGKKGKKQAVQEEAEEEVIRCVCGARATEGDDDPEAWIACDKCGVWQHNVCMGIPIHDEDIPDGYLCEECGPEEHQELLASMERGEEIWIDRRRAHEKILAEEASKKKGKKGKAKRQSDLSTPASNGKAKSPAVTADKKETPVRAGSTKRKIRDESHESVRENPAKTRKVSTPQATPKQKSPPSNLPAKIVDLTSDRQGTATLLRKRLLECIPVAVNSKTYAYSPGDTLETKSERLAIQIEDGVWGSSPNAEAYRNHCRTIAANLKSNQELVNNLLLKRLIPATLAVMSSDDMMTKELKQETDQMKALADKQAVMITDDGPRVRRTHKGDELVGGDSFTVPSDNGVMSASRRRSQLDPNGDMAARSRENSPQNEAELPGDINDHRSFDDIRGQALPKQPLNIQTKPTPIRKASARDDFDFNKVMSSVQSPTNTAHMRRPSGNAPPVTGPGEDADVDRMLEDDGDSDEYSPVEADADPGIIWRGLVSMDQVARFPAVARHVGGADLLHSMTPPVPYSDLLLKDLKIAGRIDHEKANEYLCSLRYVATFDVVIVAVSPTGEKATEAFNDIYEYFHSKARYGVLTNKGPGNVRDTYLVPIPASPAPLPDFITNFEGHKIPDNRSEAMLCVALVVKTVWDQPLDRSYDGPMDSNSPIQSHHQRQMSISATGPSMSPITAQGSFANPSTPSPHPQQHLQQPHSAEDVARHAAFVAQRDLQQRGEQVALRILGQHINDPTMRFILPQAYQMRELEWEVIKGILETDERSRHDLQHLSQVLDRKMKEEDAARNGTSAAQK